MKHFKLLLSAAATAAALLGANAASAEEQKLAYKELASRYETKDSITAETTDLLGEQIDLNFGGLSFSQTDVSIPGNGGLAVSIGRVHKNNVHTYLSRRDFADWALDIPYIQTTTLFAENKYTGPWGGWRGTRNPQECSGEWEPGSREIDEGTFYVNDFYNGDTLSIPGVTSEKLLRVPTPVDIYKKTKSNFIVKCESRANPADGEIFKVYGPDGTVYTFGQRAVVYDGIVKGTKHNSLKGETDQETTSIAGEPVANSVDDPFAKRAQMFMYVTEIEDRHGNKVNYSYTDGLLTSITSSDNRIITIERGDAGTADEGLIKKIIANGREWEYNYNSSAYLSTVTLPDGRKWEYNLSALQSSLPEIDGQDSCVNTGRERTGSITHPNGLIGSFKLRETLHGTANVEELWVESNSRRVTNPCSKQLSLVEKTLTGPGLDASGYVWTYSYSQNPGGYNTTALTEAQKISGVIPGNISEAERHHYKWSKVVAPDGSQTKYYHNRDWNSGLDGTLIATEFFDSNGGLLKREMKEYDASVAHIGTTGIFGWANIKPMEYRNNLVKSTVEMHYADGTDIFYSEYSDYNDYGKARKTYEHNNLSSGKTRYTRKGFTHWVDNAANKWILNQPTTTEISSTDSNYTTVGETTYYANTGSYPFMLYEQKGFGTWQSRVVEYTSEGLPKKVEFNAKLRDSFGTETANHRWVEYSNYYRGKPQNIKVPQRYSDVLTMNMQLTVNDDGSVGQSKDFKGNTVNFGYDAMGRMQWIDPVDSSWLDTYISWNISDIITGSAPQQTSYRCVLNSAKNSCTPSTEALETLTTLDSLLRKMTIATKDVANNKTVYQTYQYNVYGAETFKSYPSFLSTATAGTTSVYDELQRLISLSVSGGGTQYTDYLNNNKQRARDFEGNETTTTYLAFNGPETEQVLKIESPESVTTSMDYNVFGSQKWVKQDGLHKGAAFSQTQYMAYDAKQRLCKVSRNDVGTTVFSYNDAGELVYKAEGVSGGTVNDCVHSATDSQKINYIYDNGGDTRTLSYGDGTPTTTNALDFNGNLETLTFGNVVQSYSYNSSNKLELETLAFDGKSLTLDYGYNSLGHLSSLAYPDSVVGTVQFAPNAFGQPTQAVGTNTSYATNADYYATGQLNSFIYGNDVEYRMTLNGRNLPESISYKKAGVNKAALTYTYDLNNNIESITDIVESAYSITNMTYDGLDRLITVTGGTAIGNSSMSYDGLGNITSYTSKGRSLSYTYDLTTNLLTGVTDSIGDGNYDFTGGYDSRGNVVQRVKSGETRSFNYNRANQMTASSGNSYVYDGHNRRVKTVDANGTSYSMYSQSGELLYRETADGPVSYIMIGGQLIAKDGYSTPVEGSRQHNRPFGESLETPRNDIGYTGHMFDTDLGLNYMQARYYDPVIGRFYSNDPVGTIEHLAGGNGIQGFSRYAYANNNPYKYNDPTGKASEFSYLNRPMGVTVAQNLTATAEGAGMALNVLDTASDVVVPVKGLLKQGIKQGLKQGFKQLAKRSCCFVAGTQVLTEDGYKNIEDVELGEKLWAKDVETGEQAWKPVVKIFNEPDRGIYEIKLQGIDGLVQKIEATDDHPFFVVDKGWKTTIELEVDDEIETDGFGQMKVISVFNEQRVALTYNFTVADFHTYYVTKKNVLVHNCDLHSTSKSVQKAFKKNGRLQAAFEKATGKGEVGATGQEGIKALKGSKYSHEVKFKSKEFGDVRILGNKQENGTFKWEKVTDHKGVKRS